MKHYLLKSIASVLFLCMYVFPVLAQEEDPNDPDAGDDPSAPIDNWMLILVMAAIVVAVYFIQKQRQKSIA